MREITAKHYTTSSRTDVRGIIIHTAECREVRGAAGAVANYFAGEHAPKASAHYVVDSVEIVKCVDERNVAWHANEANGWSIGIEHAGTAAQTPEQWRDAYSLAELELSAQLAAGICERWDIPPHRLTDDEIRRDGRGFAGHVDVNRAFGRRGGHWDPGPHFPWGAYLTRVGQLLAVEPNERSRLGGGVLAIEGIVDGLLRGR